MKITLSIIIVVLIGSNLFWYIQDEQTDKQVSYMKTEMCEHYQIAKLNLAYPQGSEKNQVLASCSSSGFSCELKDNDIALHYDKSCPPSGRPFCGYILSFNAKELSNIQSGYPCH